VSVYPVELRQQIIREAETGATHHELAARYHLGESTVQRWCTGHTRTRTVRRLPIAPLLQFIQDRQLTLRDVKRITGVHLDRAIRLGTCTPYVADKVAVRLGVHCYDIFGDLWWQSALGDQWDVTNEWDAA
jgi:transposase-like protein